MNGIILSCCSGRPLYLGFLFPDLMLWCAEQFGRADTAAYLRSRVAEFA